MRVFVTGATGVIGRRAVPALVAAGHEVTAVGRTPEKRALLEAAGARAVEVDIFDAPAVVTAVAGHDAVVNLATAIPPSNRTMLLGAWKENDRIRTEASAILVDAAIQAGASRFVQESFAPMYASAGDEWIDEDGALDPAPHSRSTLDAEASCRRFTESGGTGVVLRFGFFYGPDGHFAEDAIRSLRRGIAPTLGHADDFMPVIHHVDAGAAVPYALTVPASIYNVVDDAPMRRRAHFEAAADALGVARPRVPPAWLAGITGSLGKTLSRSLRISNRKFKQASAWSPAYPSGREGWRAVARELAGETVS